MMKKKNCELCKELARLHCESDQASLCWTCDFKVHAANFLVARHSRTLLCHVCQSPTPWTAAGARLGSTVSVCRSCLLRPSNHRRGQAECEDEEEDVAEKEEKDVEIDVEHNHVVQWSIPPPPSSSSSNSDDDDDEELCSSASSFPPSQSDRKRRHKNVSDLYLHENRCCTASGGNVNQPRETAADAVACGGGEAGRVVDSVDSSSTRNLKRRRRGSGRFGLSGSSSWAVAESGKRIQRQEMKSAATVAASCRLSEDHNSRGSGFL